MLEPLPVRIVNSVHRITGKSVVLHTGDDGHVRVSAGTLKPDELKLVLAVIRTVPGVEKIRLDVSH